jgi:hypothetical protein
MDVRLATPDDLDAIVDFIESQHANDPTFNCWSRKPERVHIEFWIRESTIALAENNGILGLDLFEDTGLSNITVVSRDNFSEVVPALARFEQSVTGKVPFGPVSSVPLLQLFLSVGFREDEDTGLIHWVGP